MKRLNLLSTTAGLSLLLTGCVPTGIADVDAAIADAINDALRSVCDPSPTDGPSAPTTDPDPGGAPGSPTDPQPPINPQPVEPIDPDPVEPIDPEPVGPIDPEPVEPAAPGLDDDLTPDDPIPGDPTSDDFAPGDPTPGDFAPDDFAPDVVDFGLGD